MSLQPILFKSVKETSDLLKQGNLEFATDVAAPFTMLNYKFRVRAQDVETWWSRILPFLDFLHGEQLPIPRGAGAIVSVPNDIFDAFHTTAETTRFPNVYMALRNWVIVSMQEKGSKDKLHFFELVLYKKEESTKLSGSHFSWIYDLGCAIRQNCHPQWFEDLPWNNREQRTVLAFQYLSKNLDAKDRISIAVKGPVIVRDYIEDLDNFLVEFKSPQTERLNATS